MTLSHAATKPAWRQREACRTARPRPTANGERVGERVPHATAASSLAPQPHCGPSRIRMLFVATSFVMPNGQLQMPTTLGSGRTLVRTVGWFARMPPLTPSVYPNVIAVRYLAQLEQGRGVRSTHSEAQTDESRDEVRERGCAAQPERWKGELLAVERLLRARDDGDDLEAHVVTL
jgi:hypothetical protein